MSDPKLIVQNEAGELLFDTRKITYGMVKSGFMVSLGYWNRRYFKGGNVDPAIGANWTPSTYMDAPTTGNDAIHGFTIPRARSPIAFITGGGALNSLSMNPDGSATFFYTGASTSSKFYCFDLMADDVPGGPFLKTRKEDGSITFNSLQPPLNVYTTLTPPPPQLPQGQTGGWYLPYTGGSGVFVRNPFQGAVTYRFYYTVPLPGGEYAASLPWTRGAQVRAEYQQNQSKGFHGVVEGAFGVSGGVTFCFVEAGGTPYEFGNDPQRIPGTFYTGFTVDPKPTAMVISTASLPFPYR